MKSELQIIEEMINDCKKEKVGEKNADTRKITVLENVGEENLRENSVEIEALRRRVDKIDDLILSLQMLLTSAKREAEKSPQSEKEGKFSSWKEFVEYATDENNRAKIARDMELLRLSQVKSGQKLMEYREFINGEISPCFYSKKTILYHKQKEEEEEGRRENDNAD